jgi:2,3-bisphosphoglycerate-independent phosphoglycerate mutase
MNTDTSQPVLLIIRDGWGENHNPAHDSFNAIKLAHIPNSSNLSKNWPRTEITACGLDVGLPPPRHGQQRSRPPKYRSRSHR